MGLGSEFSKKGKPLSGQRDGDISAYLKPLPQKPQSVSKFCWLNDSAVGECREVVGELLNAVAIAGGAILFGFNRSGGVVITIMLGGGKMTYPFDTAEECLASCELLAEQVVAYATAQLPGRVEGAKQVGKL